jgi:Cdc6-like AAA superfamily ATPase
MFSSSNGGAAQSGQSIYSKAIHSLHISVVPDELPCREAQQRDVERHIRQFMSSSQKKVSSIYISGLPGK